MIHHFHDHPFLLRIDKQTLQIQNKKVSQFFELRYFYLIYYKSLIILNMKQLIAFAIRVTSGGLIPSNG